MSLAHVSSLGIAAYLALFAVVGILFLFVTLLVGRFVRPSNPNAEKDAIYECGEPTIGSSFVQFDLRFYVVALLFIIFDVEVAFFFPWATIFGKATHLADARLPVVCTDAGGQLQLSDDARMLYQELGVRRPALPVNIPASLAGHVAAGPRTAAAATQVVKQSARQLAWITIADIGVFFGVLLVGFAYVWQRGDLDWVRAVSRRGGATGAVPEDGQGPPPDFSA